MVTITYSARGIRFVCMVKLMKTDANGFFYIPIDKMKEYCERCETYVKKMAKCHNKLWIMNSKIAEQKERISVQTRKEEYLRLIEAQYNKAQYDLNESGARIKKWKKDEEKKARKLKKKPTNDELVRKEMLNGKVIQRLRKKANRNMLHYIGIKGLSTEKAMKLLEENKKFSHSQVEYSSKSVEFITDSVEAQLRIKKKLIELGNVPTITDDGRIVGENEELV